MAYRLFWTLLAIDSILSNSFTTDIFKAPEHCKVSFIHKLKNKMTLVAGWESLRTGIHDSENLKQTFLDLSNALSRLSHLLNRAKKIQWYVRWIRVDQGWWRLIRFDEGLSGLMMVNRGWSRLFNKRSSWEKTCSYFYRAVSFLLFKASLRWFPVSSSTSWNWNQTEMLLGVAGAASISTDLIGSPWVSESVLNL